MGIGDYLAREVLLSLGLKYKLMARRDYFGGEVFASLSLECTLSRDVNIVG